MSYRWRFDDDGRDGDEVAAASSCLVWAGWDELLPGEPLLAVEVPRARPWSLKSPSLHRLKVALLEADQLLDCVEVRFGLRVVATRGREVLLNGEPVKLFGFNRHDMTDTPVLSYGDLARDVAVLQALGSNFVRGAHYAQDQRFLDLCDVHGILVWEEVLGWQNTPEDFADGIFMSQSLKMADELATASANHPCVIFLGFFNEGASDDPGPVTRAAYSAMARRLRDGSKGSRLVSWGSSAAGMDRLLDLADVCAFHAYPAWYPTPRPVNMEEVQEIPFIWETFASWVENHFPDKPLLVTEAGAGGLYRNQGASDVKWTEEYQSLLMQMHFLSVMQNSRIAGIALWQLADAPVDRNVSSEAHRPRGLNNKGVVGLDRLPKVAFQALRLLRQPRPGQFFGLILPEVDAERLAGALRI